MKVRISITISIMDRRLGVARFNAGVSRNQETDTPEL